MSDSELHARLEADGWRKEWQGGGIHLFRKGQLVLSGADGDLPSLHWYCLTLSPEWDSNPDAAPLAVFNDESEEWADCPPRDLWADIAALEARQD